MWHTKTLHQVTKQGLNKAKFQSCASHCVWSLMNPRIILLVLASEITSPVCFTEIWLMLILMLKCYERKVLFIRWKVLLKQRSRTRTEQVVVCLLLKVSNMNHAFMYALHSIIPLPNRQKHEREWAGNTASTSKVACTGHEPHVSVTLYMVMQGFIRKADWTSCWVMACQSEDVKN
jgi:hypothetical protein